MFLVDTNVFLEILLGQAKKERGCPTIQKYQEKKDKYGFKPQKKRFFRGQNQLWDSLESCKKFLDNNIGNLNITDFSLHSIGVILFRYDKEGIFQKFVEDVIPNVRLLSFPIKLYGEVINVSRSLDLDFDDAYQYNIAKYHGLKVVTMDNDFEGIVDVEILFL